MCRLSIQHETKKVIEKAKKTATIRNPSQRRCILQCRGVTSKLHSVVPSITN